MIDDALRYVLDRWDERETALMILSQQPAPPPAAMPLWLCDALPTSGPGRRFAVQAPDSLSAAAIIQDSTGIQQVRVMPVDPKGRGIVAECLP